MYCLNAVLKNEKWGNILDSLGVLHYEELGCLTCDPLHTFKTVSLHKFLNVQ